MHAGGVMRAGDGAYVNLSRPAAARAVLDEVLRRRWGEDVELDGWAMFDAVLARIPEADR
ncbi:hypothetical protein [Nonomuraea insulae]|uniref:Uncharacterized protein n=1 Tax=Nonomuraea insulae TaxID=1616787 RepID=A0ABW1DAD8_9ACTN